MYLFTHYASYDRYASRDRCTRAANMYQSPPCHTYPLYLSKATFQVTLRYLDAPGFEVYNRATELPRLEIR
jgi:hypothetical protein